MAEHDKKPRKATDRRRGTVKAHAGHVKADSNNGAADALGIFNDRRRPNGTGKRAK